MPLSTVKVVVKFTGHQQATESTVSVNGILNLNLANGIPFATVTVVDVQCPHCALGREALNEAEKEIERLTSEAGPIDIG
jgi:protein-disulfide isomerase